MGHRAGPPARGRRRGHQRDPGPRAGPARSLPAWEEVENLWRGLVQALPLLAIGLVVLVVFFFAARLLASWFSRTGRVESPLLRNVLEKCLFLFVLIIGIYLFLRISGLTRLALTFIGGTGMLGLVIGFAFRDIAESLQRPFRLGDTIEVDGRTGVVQKVTARGTMLMDFEGNFIQIANSVVYKSTIRNFSANPKTRIDFAVGVGYDSSFSQAQQIALQVLRGHSAVLKDPAPTVLLENVGAAAITLRVYFWIDAHQHSLLKLRSSSMRLVVRALLDAGISLPDEARERIFPQGVPVRMVEGEAEQPEAAPARTPVIREDEHEATDAEGDLASEVAEIEQQARELRQPEEGEDLLSGKP